MSGLLKEVERALKAIPVLSPRAEAEMLVSHYSGLNRLELFTAAKPIPLSARRSILKALQKRRRGIPLAHVTGQAPFYGRSFAVSPDTLIPRPETERLVEEVLRVLKAHFSGQTPHILDLGTGSGCIAASLTLEWPDCKMTALDASTKALRVARKNFKVFGLGKKIQSVESRLFEHFKGKKASWDLLVSNPPYIPARLLTRLSREVRNEPRLALDGGPQGLDVVDAILEKAPHYLKPGGWLLLEIGKGAAGGHREEKKTKKVPKKWPLLSEVST